MIGHSLFKIIEIMLLFISYHFQKFRGNNIYSNFTAILHRYYPLFILLLNGILKMSLNLGMQVDMSIRAEVTIQLGHTVVKGNEKILY